MLYSIRLTPRFLKLFCAGFYVCMCVFVHVHVCVCACAYVCVFVYVCMRACVCMRMCLCVFACMYVCGTPCYWLNKFYSCYIATAVSII